MQQDQRGQQQPIQQQVGHQQPMQQHVGQQQPIQQVGYLHPVVQIQNGPARSADQFTVSALNQMKGLSITQIVVGIISILSGITLCFFGSLFFIGYGIWIGCYFVVVGGIGIGAVRRNNSCWIIAAMVLNIISAAAFWPVLLSLASLGVALHGYASSVGTAMDSILIVIALVELVVAIWSAALCCGAVCACCKATSHRMQYNAAPGMQAQPMVMFANTPGALGAPGAPGAYGSYPVQQQYAPYPAAAVPQPVGYTVQPQAPPSYDSADQSNPSHSQQPPTAYPAYPVPTKQ